MRQGKVARPLVAAAFVLMTGLPIAYLARA